MCTCMVWWLVGQAHWSMRPMKRIKHTPTNRRVPPHLPAHARGCTYLGEGSVGVVRHHVVHPGDHGDEHGGGHQRLDQVSVCGAALAAVWS